MAADGVKILLHPAITIHVHDRVDEGMKNVSLLWSRSGLRRIVGSRGTLYSTLSLTAAGNFQSNLDGRPLTVKPEVKEVFTVPEEHIVFLQMYADTPHIKVFDLMDHPITGILSSCELLHKDVSKISKCKCTRWKYVS